MSDFVNNNWFNILLWALSILITWWFSTYYFRKKKISVYSRGNRVIGYDKDLKAEVRDNLEITYLGVAIPRLTRTIYVLWSSGSSSVSREDIASRDALRIIKSDDGEIISARILKTNNESSEFQVSLSNDKSFVAIDFDYLQPKNGAVFEILHTSSSNNLDFKGSFRSDCKIEVISSYNSRTSTLPRLLINRTIKQFSKLTPTIILFTFGFMGLLLIITGMLSIFNPQLITYIENNISNHMPQNAAAAHEASNDIAIKIISILIGLLYLILPIIYIMTLVKKHPKSLDIEDLN